MKHIILINTKMKVSERLSSMDDGLAGVQDGSLLARSVRERFHQHPCGDIGREVLRHLLPDALASLQESVSQDHPDDMAALWLHHSTMGSVLQTAATVRRQ